MAAPPEENQRLLQSGLELIRQSRHAEALDCLDRLLAGDPDNVEALNTHGHVLLSLNRPHDALAVFSRVCDLAPDFVMGAHNRSVALTTLGRLEEALFWSEAALRLQPGWILPLRQRGLLLLRLGRHAEAMAAFQNLLADWPDDANTLLNRGTLLLEMNRHEAALNSYAQAIAIDPGNATAHFNQANALQALGRHEQAIAAYDQALRIDAGFISARNNRANSLRHLTRHSEAVGEYRAILARVPDDRMALANLGRTLSEIGRRREALETLDQAIALAPDMAEARWMRVASTLPAVRQPEDDLTALRAEFTQALREYDHWVAESGDLTGVTNIGRPPLFLLAYQDRNNRDLLAEYGAHCARVMGAWQDREGLRPRPRRRDVSGPLRVGIVSAHIHTQSVWLAIIRGWLQFADPKRVEYHVFYLGTAQDPQTGLAARLAHRFEQGVRSPRAWAQAILASEVDVLVYPEVGMDETTARLASMRLAPVQAMSWGHPESSGLPTMDYFVSAAALEPEAAQEHYSEKLIRLPGLGCCYTPLPLQPSPPDLPALGLSEDLPILICPGVPFKYAPENDNVYVEIAKRLGRCQMVFFRQDVNPLLSDAVFARITAAFTAAGLDIADHAVQIPWQRFNAFFGFLERADLFLDTIGFSGFNSAIQAIECGLPLVTVEGQFMRGRLASGILRTMGLDELVASDTKEYVDIVDRLIGDAAARARVRSELLQRRNRLFGDQDTVRAFEDFLHDAYQQSG